ncbi:MAG: quinone-dependent dihydroorotate dehydrogenase [Oligoflexales bacterium]|nr:quinone-dependent dihydroorotate dehydrogenase [Oligoflexales bacterium]
MESIERVAKPGLGTLTPSFSHLVGRFGTACLRRLPPEVSHHLGMQLLKSGLLKVCKPPLDQDLDISMACNLEGVGSLKHPIGLAAGFDKNAENLIGLGSMGFSWIEAGTVTPLAQSGNPKPRLFRQAEQHALVNRMGFNNAGCDQFAQNLKRQEHDLTFPIGINVGKNKITELDRALSDYVKAIRTLEGLGKYFVVNISSPNTPGLRSLSSKSFIEELAACLRSERDAKISDIWIKLDPDMSKSDFQSVVEATTSESFAGIVLTNTHRVESPFAGGQSGHPLSVKSTICLEWAHEVHKGKLPMIGCGGILSGADIFQKMIRGASAVQIYTALIYRGPFVVYELLSELKAELKLRNIRFLQDIVGAYYLDEKLS